MEINQNTEIKVQNQVVIRHKMTAKHEASPLPDKELSQMCNNNLWKKGKKSVKPTNCRPPSSFSVTKILTRKRNGISTLNPPFFRF